MKTVIELTLSTSDEIIPTRTKPKIYPLTNYILLAFIVCGDYDHVMGIIGIIHFSEKKWIRVTEWIAPEVENLIASWSVA